MIATAQPVNMSLFSDIESGQGQPLSRSVIPAVPGEYYAYSTVFTDELPLYTLMKCKASKARSIDEVAEVGREANLVFDIGGPACAHVRSVQHVRESHFPDVPKGMFGETRVGRTDFAEHDFYRLCSERNLTQLVDVCRATCTNYSLSAQLVPGSVMAVTTAEGKYGLFLVKAIASKSIQVDACHILL